MLQKSGYGKFVVLTFYPETSIDFTQRSPLKGVIHLFLAFYSSIKYFKIAHGTWTYSFWEYENHTSVWIVR